MANDWGLDRRLRYRQLERALASAGVRGPVLEVGAGPGNLTEWGWTDPVVALDLKAHDRLDVRADAAWLPFPDGSVPTTVCVDVLEHIPPALRPAVLAELVRVTSSTLVIGCPVGPESLETDRALAARLRSRGRTVPAWLLEHLEIGCYPTAPELATAAGRQATAVNAGIARWLHALIVLFQTRRGGWRLTDVAGRRAPKVLERLGALGSPYRQLAVFELEDRPLFSVVLATRNRCEQLKVAIRSVLAQDEENFELVVVDDASSDGTAALLADLANSDHRIRVVRRASASGSCGRARNRGLEVARGRLLAFLDDDNRWRPDHLRRCAVALQAAGACMTIVQRYLPDGRPLDQVTLIDATHPSVGEVDANGLAVRAESMVPFPDGQGRYHSEDIRLVHELRRRRVKLVSVPEVTVDYHFNEGSYCYAYEVVEGPEGPSIRSVPIVRSWRAVYGRVAEALSERTKRFR